MDQCQSQEIDKLVTALIASQLTMLPASKDATNPFFHSKYADLPAVWEALSPFRENGIAITQSPMDSPDGYIVLDTQLTHTSGQWMRSRLKIRVAKDDPQGVGSALTYARRYALGCMTGLVTEEDDDGNAASHPPLAKTFAQKFPDQAKKIQDKLTASPVAWIVPFGKHKGQPLINLPYEDVDWLARYYHSKLNDPANAANQYRTEWQYALIEIDNELSRRDIPTAVQEDGLRSGVAPGELPPQQVKDAPAPSIDMKKVATNQPDEQPTEDTPATPYLAKLRTCERSEKGINAMFKSIPREVQQDCYDEYISQLMAIKRK